MNTKDNTEISPQCNVNACEVNAHQCIVFEHNTAWFTKKYTGFYSNPLLPSMPYMTRLAKILILI